MQALIEFCDKNRERRRRRRVAPARFDHRDNVNSSPSLLRLINEFIFASTRAYFIDAFGKNSHFIYADRLTPRFTSVPVELHIGKI